MMSEVANITIDYECSGHSHGRALRGVADRLLAVLIAMLNQQSVIDPQRRCAIMRRTPEANP